MPVFTIETPSGKRLKIEAPDQETAIKGAQDYEAGNAQIDAPQAAPPAPGNNIESLIRGTEQTPPPSTVSDMARSGMTGVRQGTESMIGMFGDTNKMSGDMAGWAAGKLGLGETGQNVASWIGSHATPMAMMPSTSDVRQLTTPIAGENYQPQTVAGEYARTVGQFVPGAALGPGGLMRKAAMTVVPAVASETAGQMTKGTEAEPYARAAGGLFGAGVSSLRLPMPRLSGGGSSEALLQRALQSDSIPINEVGSRLAALGPDAMIADLGPNLQRQAGAIAANPGRGQQIVRSAISNRDTAANSRIRSELDQTLGVSPVPSAVDAGIQASQNALSPAYAEVFRNARGVDTSHIANSLESQIVNLRGEGQRAARNVREMLNVNGTRELDPHPYTLFQTRQAIDGLLATEANPNAIRVLSAARHDVDNLLARSVPGLKEVDAQFAELSRQREALGRGQQVLESGRTAPRPQELAAEVQQGALPQGRQIGPSAAPIRLQQGARAEIERIVGTNANDRVALQKIIKGEGDWNRDRLATLFGQARADRIINVLDRERTFADTSQIVTRNSETAARLAAGEDIKGGLNGPGIRDGYVAGGSLGILRAAGVKAGDKVLQKWRSAKTEAETAKLAEALTSGDRNRVIGALLRSPTMRRQPKQQIYALANALLQSPAAMNGPGDRQ